MWGKMNDEDRALAKARAICREQERALHLSGVPKILDLSQLHQVGVRRMADALLSWEFESGNGTRLGGRSRKSKPRKSRGSTSSANGVEGLTPGRSLSDSVQAANGETTIGCGLMRKNG